MNNILDENDIKILNILSKNEDKCFIKNPQTTFDHIENAYVYKNSILSKKAIDIKFKEEWKINKQLGVAALTKFVKNVVSEAIEKYKKSSIKKQLTIDHIFGRILQNKKVKIIYSI